jgi:hypothetical protein
MTKLIADAPTRRMSFHALMIMSASARADLALGHCAFRRDGISEGRNLRNDPLRVPGLNFIRHARDLGFQLRDIRELLTMSAHQEASCDAADSIARSHLKDVGNRIRGLVALRGELSRTVQECRHGEIADCRVIEVLNDHRLRRGRHRPE